MTLEQIRGLMTVEGQQVLAAAVESAMQARTAPSVGSAITPASVARLRAGFGQELVSAALTLHGLRVRAQERFSRGAAMFFDGSDLLEQATSEPVARHKAARFAGIGTVVDLCCGAGGDSIQIARQVERVIGVDSSLVRLVCLRANAEAYDVAAGVRAVAADIERWVPRADACHIDPPRRDNAGRRQLKAKDWDPWIARVRHLAGECRQVGAKFSPAVQPAQLDWAEEVEFISENGTLKQATAWTGQLARWRRSATVIRSTAGLTKAVEVLASDEPAGTPREIRPLEAGLVLHEPDAAVVRAGLLGNLALRLGAGLVDSHLPLLAGVGEPAETWLARRYEVLEVAGWSSKKVKQLIRQRGWRVTEVKTRAFACQPEEILAGLRSLKPDPAAPPVVLWAVRLGSKPMCILTRRIERNDG